MNPTRLLAVTFTIGVFLTLVGCATGSSTGGSLPHWTRYLRPVNFPAKVKSVVFYTGNVLDQSRSMRWGQWTVSFGSELPFARYRDYISSPLGGGRYEEILIQNLICRNEVSGKIPCEMDLTLYPIQEGGAQCGLVRGPIPRLGNFLFRINCPEKVVFK